MKNYNQPVFTLSINPDFCIRTGIDRKRGIYSQFPNPGIFQNRYLLVSNERRRRE